MPKEIKGIIVSRLVVFISIIFVPIIIFLIFLLADFYLWFSDDPNVTFLIIKVLCPFIFSISWLFFLILFATRFSKTIEGMDKTVRVVPLRLKFFFGINALYILAIFIFPLITPLISILSFTSMAWRLTTFRKESWDDSETSFFTRFLMVLAAVIPIFCTICIIPNFITLSLFLWNDIWLPLLDLIFLVSMCLCTALAIGSLFILIQNSGISEVEQIFTDPDESPSMWPIRIGELLLFIFFLWLAIWEFKVIDLFYNAGFFIVLFVAMINFFKGKQKLRKFRAHLFGYLLAAVFMGSNLLIFSVEFSELLKVWSLLISAALFIAVFFYTFIRLEESEL